MPSGIVSMLILMALTEKINNLFLIQLGTGNVTVSPMLLDNIHRGFYDFSSTFPISHSFSLSFNRLSVKPSVFICIVFIITRIRAMLNVSHFHLNCQDNKDARHVKTYEVLLKEKDFGDGPWVQNNLDNGAGLLIPVPLPLGGVIIVGEQTIVYYNGFVFKAISIRPV